MTNNEEKFWNILADLFVGADTKGVSGFINLMVAKQSYFKKVQTELLENINNVCKDNKEFKDELYDKLYSFFHRYFSISGSIFYNYTPLYYNVYTKAYQEDILKNASFCTDYEQIISVKNDTSLFYKTQMLYYVKSDRVFKNLEISFGGGGAYKYIFDVSELGTKFGNEKKDLIYTLKSLQDKSIHFSVSYKQGNSNTKIADILKEAKHSNMDITEEDLKKAFKIFEKQSNVDYFINKNAKKFLKEQLDMWVYQYMFSQEASFNSLRFDQIQNFKKIAYQLIDFISQFEDELVKIWNKPRFVLNSNIVVSIDRLLDKGFDINKLKNHSNFKKQQREWQDLGINTGSNLIENEFLPIDTKHFSEFKEEIEELFHENEFDGLLIKSENYQALNTIKHRFRDKVDLIYIDPPFNTGSDFSYIDGFQDSTWLTLIENRLEIARDILSKKGSFYLHLDHNANYMGRELLNKIFGKENFVNEIIWYYSNKMANSNHSFAKNQETIYLFKKTDNYIFSRIKEKRETPVLLSKREGRDGKNMRARDESGNIVYTESYERYVDEVWRIPIIGSTSKERNPLFGSTQKPEALIKRVLETSSNPDSIILDYHLGSGTTVATAQKLKRKYIGIEMGEHFYDVVIPRIKKVLSGFSSGISKDISYKGGGIFKYYELEQYEQILKTTKYSNVPSEYLENKESSQIKDCFLFDEKLSFAISAENSGFKVDLAKLYPDIDLKETIFNLTGKRPKRITDTKVIFEDKEYELLEILKPLLVW